MTPRMLKLCAEGKGHLHLGISSPIEFTTSNKNVPRRQESFPNSTVEYNYFAIIIRHCAILFLNGEKAYECLPKGWNGKCGLGHAVTAMRVLTALHVVQDLFTHLQTPWTKLFSTLIPSYGVMAALDQISQRSCKLHRKRHVFTLTRNNCCEDGGSTKSCCFGSLAGLSRWNLYCH